MSQILFAALVIVMTYDRDWMKLSKEKEQRGKRTILVSVGRALMEDGGVLGLRGWWWWSCIVDSS